MRSGYLFSNFDPVIKTREKMLPAQITAQLKKTRLDDNDQGALLKSMHSFARVELSARYWRGVPRTSYEGSVRPGFLGQKYKELNEIPV